MTADVTIRPARPDDAEAMSEVLCASIRTLCAPDHQDDTEVIDAWTRNKSPRGVRQWFDNPDVSIFVALTGTAVAGVGGISADGHVILNYVAPDHRFEGVSRAMMARLESELAGRGIAEARLTSTATAHRFYKSIGWSDSGAPESGRAVTGYPMSKRLGADKSGA